MTRQVALLRGVNLGRNRRLLMAELREVVDALGYDDVRTHLQSGNVVLTSGKKPATVKRELERAIADKLGLETEVFMRTRDELAAVIARDPLGAVADNPARYRVSAASRSHMPGSISSDSCSISSRHWLRTCKHSGSASARLSTIHELHSSIRLTVSSAERPV